jgi:glycosyltransferase involved in cell wall biosynthesis
MSSISCIITSFNNAAFLDMAIESVIAQTRRPDEIIIADDCSTDDSHEIINAFASQYSTIRPVFREKNIGVGANRDLALRSASCDLITFLDGDDWFFPEKIEAEERALSDQMAIAYSDVILMRSADAGTTRMGMRSSRSVDRRFRSLSDGLEPDDFRPDLMRHSYTESGRWDMGEFPGDDDKMRPWWISTRCQPIPTHMMLPKKIYEEAGGILRGVNLYEDWDLKIRLSCLPYKWVYSGVAGMAYRMTESGLSSVSAVKRLVGQLSALRRNRPCLARALGWSGYMNTFASIAMRAYTRRPGSSQ